MMAKVYFGKKYDINTDVSPNTPWKGTAECLRQRQLTPILETEEEVDDEKLDSEGRYYP
jgi:hypothetical protein